MRGDSGLRSWRSPSAASTSRATCARRGSGCSARPRRCSGAYAGAPRCRRSGCAVTPGRRATSSARRARWKRRSASFSWCAPETACSRSAAAAAPWCRRSSAWSGPKDVIWASMSTSIDPLVRCRHFRRGRASALRVGRHRLALRQLVERPRRRRLPLPGCRRRCRLRPCQVGLHPSPRRARPALPAGNPAHAAPGRLRAGHCFSLRKSDAPAGIPFSRRRLSDALAAAAPRRSRRRLRARSLRAHGFRRRPSPAGDHLRLLARHGADAAGPGRARPGPFLSHYGHQVAVSPPW